MKHTFIKLGIFGIVLALLAGCLQNHTTSTAQDVENQVADTSTSVESQIVDTLPKVELTHEEAQSLALLDTSFTVSEEEASSTVLSIIQELEQQNSGIGMKTTFRKPRTIASIKPFKRHKESLGKSSSTIPADTTSELYLINFADEQGFAVTSADRRVANGGLLAFVPEGNLNEGDTVDNPGMALFAEGLEEYIEEEKERFRERVEHLEPAIEKIAETLPDSIKEILLDSNQVSLRKKAGWEVINDEGRGVQSLWGLYIMYHYHIEKEYVRSIKPPISVVEWGQGDNVYKIGGDPIDDYLTYANTGVSCGYNRRPKAGCVATATAQIMAKYRYPAWINGRYMNWAPMSVYPIAEYITNSDSRGDISTLFEWIGKEVGMKYGCKESNTLTSKGVDLLKRQGYHVGSKRGYNFNDVVSSINNGRMVLMQGFTGRHRPCFLGICATLNYNGGHAWVVDGYMTRWYTLATGIEIWSKNWSQLLYVTRGGGVQL
jgi:hypothetical protein